MGRQRQPLRLAILEAERLLAAAGIASPRVDAELIAAHVLGVERGRLPMVPLVDPPVVDAIGQLVAQRAKHVPLQHLTGWAAMGGITVGVGPGVFVPRPETELLLEWGLAAIADIEQPVVVDLCTGTGALADCEAMIDRNVKDALSALDSAPITDESRSALADLAVAATSRTD